MTRRERLARERRHRVALASRKPMGSFPFRDNNADPKHWWAANVDEENLSAFLDRAGGTEHRQRQLFREFLCSEPHSSMLDCGGGVGIDCLGLRKHAIPINYTLVDITPMFVGRARRHGVHAVLGDVCSLDFADASFDLVYSKGLIDHLKDHQQAIREMVRVARHSVYICSKSIWSSDTLIRTDGAGVFTNRYNDEEFLGFARTCNRVSSVAMFGEDGDYRRVVMRLEGRDV